MQNSNCPGQYIKFVNSNEVENDLMLRVDHKISNLQILNFCILHFALCILNYQIITQI
jgi:hypothetical protein